MGTAYEKSDDDCQKEYEMFTWPEVEASIRVQKDDVFPDTQIHTTTINRLHEKYPNGNAQSAECGTEEDTGGK